MTVVAAIEAVAITIIVLLFLRHIRLLETAQSEERRILADRIQKPELLPARPSAPFIEPVAREDDQLNMVGKIRIYGDEE
jgi:hypothetical protein